MDIVFSLHCLSLSKKSSFLAFLEVDDTHLREPVFVVSRFIGNKTQEEMEGKVPFIEMSVPQFWRQILQLAEIIKKNFVLH